MKNKILSNSTFQGIIFSITVVIIIPLLIAFFGDWEIKININPKENNNYISSEIKEKDSSYNTQEKEEIILNEEDLRKAAAFHLINNYRLFRVSH